MGLSLESFFLFLPFLFCLFLFFLFRILIQPALLSVSTSWAKWVAFPARVPCLILIPSIYRDKYAIIHPDVHIYTLQINPPKWKDCLLTTKHLRSFMHTAFEHLRSSITVVSYSLLSPLRQPTPGSILQITPLFSILPVSFVCRNTAFPAYQEIDNSKRGNKKNN